MIYSWNPSSPIDGMKRQALLLSIWRDFWQIDTTFTKDCIHNAEERIRNTTIDTFKNSVTGYDTVSLKRTQYELGKININYALAPVWFLNTEWNGKFYTFAMNGQTGKIIGDDMPIDKGIMIRKFLMVAVAVALIIFIAGIFIYPRL